MLGRITRSFVILSPHLQRSKQIANVQQRMVRLLSQTPVFNVAKQVEEDTDDLLFDLGGSGKNLGDDVKGQEKRKQTTKKPKDNEEKSAQQKTSAAATVTPTKSKAKRKEKIPDEKRDRTFEQLKFHDPALKLTYVKLPFGHGEFQNLMLMLKSRKYREVKNLLLIEGRRLTIEAIEAGLKIRYLMFSNVKQIEAVRDLIEPAFTKKTEVIRVPHNDLSYWSTLTTCPGLIAIFEKPKDMTNIWKNSSKSIDAQVKQIEATQSQETANGEKSLVAKSKFISIPITVICDQVREPNNLGGIIRTCAAIPCAQVVLMKGCADPWDVKALRGGCGSQFRIPIIGPIEWEDLTAHLPDAHDISIFIADNQTEQSDTTTMARDEFEQKRKQNNAKYFRPKVYSDVPFHNCKHIALIIGGETEGVSSHALDFMNFVTQQKEHNEHDDGNSSSSSSSSTENASKIVRPDNSVLEIPLGNGVESLNASVATAILLFEMRKQLLQ